MVSPDKVKKVAEKKENENLKFRTYLKMHAEEEELDAKFLRLHNELFPDYDCNSSRNCCKMYKGTLKEENLEGATEALDITLDQLKDFFLDYNEMNMQYDTKHEPCDFLGQDGECKLGDVKPDNCKDFPYTDQPERLWSLYSVLDAITVCPVAFEIFERLKKEYGFRPRGK